MQRFVTHTLLIGLMALALVGCGLNPEPMDGTYADAQTWEAAPHSLLRDDVADLLKRHRAMPPLPMPQGQPVADAWAFAVGDPAKGLDVTAADRPAPTATVSLPDRGHLPPHTPFWYAAPLAVDQDQVLKLRVDDGAQVFWLGQALKPIGPELYPLPAGTDTLVIRVLNGAVKGGLISAQVIPKPRYLAWADSLRWRQRLATALEKVVRMQNPPYDVVKNARIAINHPMESPQLSQLEVFLDAYPMPVFGPMLQDASPTRAKLVWAYDDTVSCRLRYGHRPDSLNTTLALDPLPKQGALHVATLKDLPPGKPVYYRLESKLSQSRVYRFTLPKPNDTMANLALFGDPQGGWATFRQVTGLAARYPVDASLGLGDLVNDGADPAAWRAYARALDPLAAQTPHYVTGGNHDYDGWYAQGLRNPLFANLFHQTPAPHYTAFSWGPARVVMLDPNERFPLGLGDEQRAWFEQQIQDSAWTQAAWRILVVHQPPFSQAWDGYPGEPIVRQLVDTLAPRHGLDVVLSGHTHAWERLSVPYGNHHLLAVVCGTAGGGLETKPNQGGPTMGRIIKQHGFGHLAITPSTLRLRFVAADGRVLDDTTWVRPLPQPKD